jgi:hypothetical protein
MKQNYILFFLFFLSPLAVSSQIQLSEKAEISIVTAGSGSVLYEAFGHSAIRIKDNEKGFDVVYNYGIFDFNAPNFYTNFVKGKLLYQLGRYDFKYFLYSYDKDKRWVKQQILSLNQKEKQAYFNFLENNTKPENKSYLYDPFFDNCATKLRDITQSVLKEKVTFYDNHLEKGLSFRTLMNRELHYNSWGSLGINIALGSKLDAIADPLQYMYLPDYVLAGFKNGKNGNTTLVLKEETLINHKPIVVKSVFFNPYLIISILSLLGIFITYKDFRNNKRTKVVDFLSFFISGILGVLIVFLWFFTNHSTTPNNFNFLWAFAPNIVVAFLLLKNTKTAWLNYYFTVLLFFLGIIPIIWLSSIQVFHLSLLPFLAFLFLRLLFLRKSLLTSKI